MNYIIMVLYTDCLPKWPRVLLEVSSLDYWDRHRIEGYGFVDLPCRPGKYAVLRSVSINASKNVLNNCIMSIVSWWSKSYLHAMSFSQLLLVLVVLVQFMCKLYLIMIASYVPVSFPDPPSLKVGLGMRLTGHFLTFSACGKKEKINPGTRLCE